MATTDDFGDQVGSALMDQIEEASDAEEGEEDSLTVEYNGRKGTVSGHQLSMLGKHPMMDEHVKMVKEAVQRMASQVIDAGKDGEFAQKLKIKSSFLTNRGVPMDAVLTITFSAKPAPPPKD